MRKAVLLLAVFLALSTAAYAGSFVSGSTGADGAFAPVSNTVLPLPPNGVFNFTSVNIPAGVTVTFQKNSANTPVYILATGDVFINGTIDVSGTSANGMWPGLGGPGGFSGGEGGEVTYAGGNGLGPGGGTYGCANCYYSYGLGGGGGGFGSGGGSDCYGWAGGTTYLNGNLVTMSGGSGGGGGGGSSSNSAGGGGGGGGAILIASSGTIYVGGSILANGGAGCTGNSNSYSGGGGGGSGGAIKLMADTINGNGTLTANGGAGGGAFCGGGGGTGYVRLETNNLLRTNGTSPAYSEGFPGQVFASTMPVLNITSISGVNVPASTTGSYSQPDIVFPAGTTNPVLVVVSAQNIPVGTNVTLTSVPEHGAPVTASGTLTGTTASSSVNISISLDTTNSSVLTLSATFQLTASGGTASAGWPVYADGEMIKAVKVTSVLGGKSKVVYILESGKEVTAG